MTRQYETVIGLEVHVELATKTKIFCSCSTQFGGAPNTHTCPVCTGMPGALPVLNRQVVEYAMAIGLATGTGYVGLAALTVVIVSTALLALTALLAEIRSVDAEISSPQYENQLAAYQRTRSQVKGIIENTQADFSAILRLPSLNTRSSFRSLFRFLVPSGKIQTEIPFFTFSIPSRIVFRPALISFLSRNRQLTFFIQLLKRGIFSISFFATKPTKPGTVV